MDRPMYRTTWSLRIAAVSLALSVVLSLVPAAPVAAQGDALVTVGSPTDRYPRNAQDEPGLAVDLGEVARGRRPLILAAGANDRIDQAPCPNPACDIPPGVGVSGVYFSFDGGQSWIQPTYTGWSARDGTAEVGPIGTLPKYYENRLVADGDPALAFGPQPDGQGGFSWDKGSRLYYANIATNFPGSKTRDEVFKGQGAIAVSRTDDVRAAAANDERAWLDPVIVTRQSSALFSDKEAIWADNAESSPFFGNVYVCNVAFRGLGQGRAVPEPVMVARSTDGGDSWQQKQISQAANAGGAGRSGGRQGCTVRTDSQGVVYVFWDGILKRQSVQYLSRSVDGGKSFEKPQPVANIVECGEFDPVSGDNTFDGVAGARTNSFPSVDIANGAPTGAGAPNTIVMMWCDASNGLNHEQALVQRSTDQGKTWSKPTNGAERGDRPDFPAIAISPDGTDVYFVYDAFLDPWRETTADPRRVQGVVRHADSQLNGWTTLHRGAVGDARAAHVRFTEFLGDYNYTAATNEYGAAVWVDVRRATLCPAIDAFRQALVTQPDATPPNVATDCPPTWGNADIFGGHYADPDPDVTALGVGATEKSGHSDQKATTKDGKKAGKKSKQGGRDGDHRGRDHH
jgi:hypothetical protein